MKTQLLFDLESTGLLRQGSRIHCIVTRDADEGNTEVYDHLPERALVQGVKQLEKADADRSQHYWRHSPPTRTIP